MECDTSTRRPTTFGVHLGVQHTTPAELLPLYRHAADLGFGWISVWDHFYTFDVEALDRFSEAFGLSTTSPVSPP